MVLVTHTKDPCEFMIQRVANMEQLQLMMNIINIYCDSTENVHDLLYDVKFGMLFFVILVVGMKGLLPCKFQSKKHLITIVSDKNLETL